MFYNVSLILNKILPTYIYQRSTACERCIYVYLSHLFEIDVVITDSRKIAFVLLCFHYNSLRENCPNMKLFLVHIFLYLVHENMDQKKPCI